MYSIIDAYSCQLRESGVGTEVKCTSIITKEEEIALWGQGVSGVDTPECLLLAPFFSTMGNTFV